MPKLSLEEKLARPQIEIPGESVCTRCELSKRRNKVVLSEGGRNADVLVLGEAPGSQENLYGRPFFGSAGDNLDLLLQVAKIDRSRVLIANMIACAPLRYRERLKTTELGQPKKAEMDSCAYWLDQKILAGNITTVIPVGNYALKKFLPHTSISKVHGKAFEVDFKAQDKYPVRVHVRKEKAVRVDNPDYDPTSTAHKKYLTVTVDATAVKTKRKRVVNPDYNPASTAHKQKVTVYEEVEVDAVEWHELPLDCPKSKRLLIVPQFHPALPLHKPAFKSVLVEDYSHISEAFSRLPQRPDTANYKLVASWEDIKQIEESVVRAGKCAIDFETSGSDSLLHEIIGVSISTGVGVAWYIPTFDQYFNVVAVIRWLNRFIDSNDISTVFHRGAFEMSFIWRTIRERTTPANYYDTAIEYFLLEAESNHLKDLALRELNVQMTPISTFIGTGKTTTRTMLDASRENLLAVANYSCSDSDMTLRLHNLAVPRLKECDLWNHYTTVELPLIPILARMQLAGASVNQQTIADLDVLYRQKHDEIGAGLWKAVVEAKPPVEGQLEALQGINLDSPEQVSWLLFDYLKLPPPRVRGKIPVVDKGFISTNSKDVLDEMEPHPVVEAVQRYREYSKLLGYTKALSQPHPTTGKIHTHFNQDIVKSYRLSSSKPVNLQQVPSKTEDGRLLRGAFVPSPGNVILKADVNQAELRVEASLSRDRRKLEIYSRVNSDGSIGGDIHGEANQLIFGSKPDFEKNKEMYRKRTKAGNFGTLYRGGVHTIAHAMGVILNGAADFMAQQKRTFPGSERYFHEAVKKLHALGYSTSPLGGRRTLPNLKSVRPKFVREAEREGYNNEIQMAVSILLKRAMIRIQSGMDKLGLKAQMIIQVHDELIFDVAPPDVEQLKGLINSAFDVPELIVPMKVDIGVGPNWLACK
mgnify:CR=1 FL=1